MEALLDFSKPLDVALLTQVVHSLNQSPDKQVRDQADKVLTAFKENALSWQRAGQILEESNDIHTKFFALKVLEDTIKYRWKALPMDQRQGIRNYVVKKIIDISSSEEIQGNKDGRTFLNKLNLILVEILKQEWPDNWPNFISEIVDSSSKSEILCENNMRILKYLSEEVFDFSKEEMTSDKVRLLKNQLNSEFKRIFELCQLVLTSSTRPGLIVITLQTLLRFLAWIPLGYVFETNLVDHLTTKFLGHQQFRNDTLACLTEIASLKQTEYNHVFLKIFMGVMNLLQTQLPPETDIPREYSVASDRECTFIRYLALFFSAFFSNHLDMLELPENHQNTITAFYYLLSISLVDDDEIFKICLEFWTKFTRSLYADQRSNGSYNNGTVNGGTSITPIARKELYSTVLSRVRGVMISKMAKPEEVLIVEDDDGNIIREMQKDTAAIAQYKTMRDTLVYLTHLDYEDTENIMLSQLSRQCAIQGHESFDWTRVNTLCWAIGSISGAMNEDDEKRFLVTVIKDLLTLCEKVRGKDNKAVVASNIMYVVGQYPRFLHAHWKFLKTVVYKLFEFMHELHPGVQDMACDTFLKIAQKCKRQFVIVQAMEQRAFVDDLLDTMQDAVRDLSQQQRYTFYEAVACMIREQQNPQLRDSLLDRLMQPAQQKWAYIMELAGKNTQELTVLDNISVLADILKTNVHVCKSMGSTFRPQMMRLFLDMLNVYKFYGQTITQRVMQGGDVQIQHKDLKSMRTVKVEILKLIRVFVDSNEDPQDIANTFCPHLEPILVDYQTCPPPARLKDVLELFVAIVETLKESFGRAMDGTLLEKVLSPLFNPTLEMITRNFVDFPEHRVQFFKLIAGMNRYCFERLFSIPPTTQKDVVNSIVWAFKHTDRNISEIGLTILDRLLDNLLSAPDSFSQEFYRQYFMSLLQDVLYVLTDRLHKYSFSMHAAILQKMFLMVQQGRIKVPLGPGSSNQEFVQNYTSQLISDAFSNIGRSVVEGFVSGLFDPQKDYSMFKAHVRDFLIRLKEFSADDDLDDLYSKEREEEKKRVQQQNLQQRAAVPGLLTQQEQDEMADL